MEYTKKSPNINIIYTSLKGDKYELKSQEIGGDLISLNTEKNISSISGSFTFRIIARGNLQTVISQISNDYSRLTKRNSAFTIFQPSGLVDIYINEKEVMIGTIDSIHREKSISDSGIPNFVYTIKGRDLGKYLEDYTVWFEKNPNPITKNQRLNNSLLGGYIFMDAIKNTTPHEIMEKVYSIYFEEILNKTISGLAGDPFSFVDGKEIQEKLTCSSSSGSGLSSRVYIDQIPLSFQAFSKEATLWDFMKSFTSIPLNEMFVETGGTNISLDSSSTDNALEPRKGHVIFRPCPYDDKSIETLSSPESLLDINDLLNFEIEESEVTSESLTFGMNNTPSVYRVFPMAGYIPTTQAGYIVDPLYDQRALKRYGYKQFEVAIEGIDSKKNGYTSNIKDVAENYQKKLKSWFRNNDLYVKGSIGIGGREEIRIGNKLTYLTDDTEVGGYYYITGVSHSYNYGFSYSTRLNVDRGVTTDKKIDFKKENRL